ncbi:lipopolysaccharide biosynthesis protein [Congregibacter litoralis]|uniref:Membrane protein involved in the export of O-antigen and teichoic acid n=1 Tax=Congregibacter litoralis KT71 TaxID=314285 RepID=A4AB90_9GAMM|nr:oligosaccharide flippase family protein [Congregibacter litoralis]EAQ96644.1 Membrane protein involved in the export of O-antigen and teichoic acid [Congregibacter litoralis KT71]
MSEGIAARRLLPASGLPAALWKAGTLAISRGTGMAAQMAVQVAVGALAGPAGIGALQLHMAWGSLLGELVGAGEPTRALRDHSLHHQRESSLKEGLLKASKTILKYSGALAVLVMLLVLSGLAESLGLSSDALLLSIVVSAPLFALTRLFAETLKALNQALWAVSLENSVMPLVILGTCGLIALEVLVVSQAIILSAAVVGLLLGLCLMTASLLKSRRDREGRDPLSQSTTENPAKPDALHVPGETLHFWLNGLFNIAFLQLPFLIMPWLVSVEEVGRYAVAHKLLNVITTLLILLSAVYGPKFARAAATTDRKELAGLLAATQRISLAIFIPAAAAMLSFADPLAKLFSLSAGSLLPLLLLLCTGQLINAATGLSGVLLNMSGAAHLEFRVLTVSCVTTLVLAIPLGLYGGAPGIAAAIAGGISLRNILSYIAVRRHINSLGANTP